MNAKSVVLAAAVLLGSVGLADAQPVLSDIALCNEEATNETGGSAFPSPPPGPKVARQSPAQKETQKMPQARGGQTREKTDPSGSVITESPDPLVTGMNADKADDPAYRTAYRDCMRRQMGKRR